MNAGEFSKLKVTDEWKLKKKSLLTKFGGKVFY